VAVQIFSCEANRHHRENIEIMYKYVQSMLGSSQQSLICSCSVLKVRQCITTPHHQLKFGEWGNRAVVYAIDLNLCILKALLLPHLLIDLRRSIHNRAWKRIAVSCIFPGSWQDEWAYCFNIVFFSVYKLNTSTLTRVPMFILIFQNKNSTIFYVRPIFVTLPPGISPNAVK
jgi:hypothetical protein